jgi:hypothetical protein
MFRYSGHRLVVRSAFSAAVVFAFRARLLPIACVMPVSCVPTAPTAAPMTA